MNRPQIAPTTFLKYMTDEDLIEVWSMGEMEKLCNAMTIDYHMLTENIKQNEA